MIQQLHDACHCLPWFALAEAVMEQQNTVTNKKVHFLEYQPSSSKLFFSLATSCKHVCCSLPQDLSTTNPVLHESGAHLSKKTEDTALS